MDQKEETEDDIQQGAVLNLLGFRNVASSNFSIDGNQQQERSVTTSSTENSTIIDSFQPKFLIIYDKFVEYCERDHHHIDITLSLLSICLNNLLLFSFWARINDDHMTWMKGIFEDNIDLRPEVRNGLALIYIYAISAAKARHESSLEFANNVNMFSILQDAEVGLGIVNKTSLKIYNDPFNYFSFLKCCLSGLIDCGKIPENERVNQPKKPASKKNNEIKYHEDEWNSYLKLKESLVNELNNKENLKVRSQIQEILNVWQHRNKNEFRGRRFAMAVLIIVGDKTEYEKETIITREVIPKLLNAVSSVDTPIITQKKRSFKEINNNDGNNMSLPAIRFDRVGYKEWDFKENKIFSAETLIKNNKSCVFFLIDDSQLNKNLHSKWTFKSDFKGFKTLQEELQSNNLLVTSWPSHDHNHFLDFINNYTAEKTKNPVLSIGEYWCTECPNVNKTNYFTQKGGEPFGMIGYEVINKIGIVVRKNISLGIKEDCWRLLFVKELYSNYGDINIIAFLVEIFPQLRSSLGKLLPEQQVEILIKYHSHPMTSLDHGPILPREAETEMYQTIGSLKESTNEIFSRMNILDSFHDIVLQRAT